MIKITCRLFLVWISAILLVPVAAWSESSPALRLGVPFADHAVLQCELPLNIWGNATPGSSIAILLDGKPWGNAMVDAGGHWKTQLPGQLPSSTPHAITVQCGGERVELNDILFGEVWLASGQSNMAFGLNKAKDGESLRPASGTHFRFANVQAQKGFPDAPEKKSLFWNEFQPGANNWVSAVAAYFGVDLAEKLDRPVGIIVCAVGATPAEAWTPLSALEAHPETAGLARLYRRTVEGKTVDELKALHQVKVAEWKKNNPGESFMQIPDSPFDNNFPVCLYENMIVPLVPFTMRGVIWYQGENNANFARADQYRVLFPAMIQSWRDVWASPDLPFLFVQLAAFNAKEGGEWPELREAQAFTRDTVPSTGMAVAIDVGMQKDIHPKNKKPVGERLAKLALKQVYGKDVVALGPVPINCSFADNRATIRFDFAGDGLKTRDSGASVPGFELAGADGKFHSAAARITTADTVELTCPDVGAPKAVRYAFSAWVEPPTTLENSDGLPAEPFRRP
ncbi:MAG: sialate O-acetylesterase [Kiritimatiellales bacterium]|nr:sialate O-acetylesterase [Kiritimatiellales bacterium]